MRDCLIPMLRRRAGLHSVRLPRWLVAVVCLVAVLVPATAADNDSPLTEHPSPYIAMHAGDPVHWQLWSAETLQRAKALNRPLLVSVGYFSCHWCHVMQRESYRDPVVADLINAHFVPVKVDRELEPALDAHLIEFMELTRGRGGWPVNVFLTPDGYPLAGVLYEPKDRFRAVLEEMQRRWQANPEALTRLAKRAVQEWRALRRGDVATATVATMPFESSLKKQAASRADELAGGFGESTKFPMAPQLLALLSLASEAGEPPADDFLRLTLDQMAEQGLHDLLGGGFFRYVSDPAWQVPHYEKMLYDNALLARLYLAAAQRLDAPRYRRVGLETLDFMLREMRKPQGYFVSSFSAVDEQGREGFYYLWDQATLRGALSDDQLRVVQAAWFDAHAASSEYGRLPRWQRSGGELSKMLGWSAARVDRTLDSARRTLLGIRADRSLPVDDKGVAAWNGLALSALAAGYAATDGERYGPAARGLASYLATQLWDGSRLFRARDANRNLAEGTLEDYALVALGLWDWDQANGSDAHAELVEQLVRVAWKRFYVDERWRQTDTALIPMVGGRVAVEDGPLPSSTAAVSLLVEVHPRLAADPEMQKRLDEHLAAARAYLVDAAFWYPSYLPLLAADQASR
jgi:hypothetical protein